MRSTRATLFPTLQAVKRLQETLAWRVANGVESAACPACAARPGSHYMHPVGFDARGRPVLYSCLQLASCRSVDDNKAHVIATFEQVRPSRHPPAGWCRVLHVSRSPPSLPQQADAGCHNTAHLSLPESARTVVEVFS